MPVWDPDRDAAVRLAAMAYINRITGQSGGYITRTQLEAFTFDGHAIKLIDQSRGIRNPAMLPATLSILTNPRSGYADQAGPDGFPRYSIRTGDWAHGDNRKLHAAFELEVPIIWLQTISPGRFVSVAPVYLVEADPANGHYTLAISNELRSAFRSSTPLEATYAESITRRRLHQPAFRLRVMDAYSDRCAICSLGHPQLLDAAHITPDRDVTGTTKRGGLRLRSECANKWFPNGRNRLSQPVAGASPSGQHRSAQLPTLARCHDVVLGPNDCSGWAQQHGQDHSC